MNNSNTDVPNIEQRLKEVLALIEPLPLREAVAGIFKRLTVLVEYSDLLEICLSSEQALLKSPLLFSLLQEKSLDLIAYMRTRAKQAEGATEAFGNLLESTVFAISHEIKRAGSLTAPETERPAEQLRTEYTRAHGLLLNCFQQSIISIALAFDSSISGTQLFADFKLKLDQSLVLYQALSILIEQTNLAERERNLDSYFAMIEGLKMFGQGYIHYLMYRDWAEFERLTEKIRAARTEYELWPQVKQFARYLETLLCHVRMRSVLQNQPLREPSLTMQ